MNERIRELANEAGLLVHNPNGVPTKLEKFAELIIQEMCEVMTAESKGFDLCSNYGAVQGIDVGVRKVKQHFGVKE